MQWNAGDMDAFCALHDPDVDVRLLAGRRPEPGILRGRDQAAATLGGLRGELGRRHVDRARASSSTPATTCSLS